MGQKNNIFHSLTVKLTFCRQDMHFSFLKEKYLKKKSETNFGAGNRVLVCVLTSHYLYLSSGSLKIKFPINLFPFLQHGVLSYHLQSTVNDDRGEGGWRPPNSAKTRLLRKHTNWGRGLEDKWDFSRAKRNCITFPLDWIEHGGVMREWKMRNIY